MYTPWAITDISNVDNSKPKNKIVKMRPCSKEKDRFFDSNEKEAAFVDFRILYALCIDAPEQYNLYGSLNPYSDKGAAFNINLRACKGSGCKYTH